MENERGSVVVTSIGLLFILMHLQCDKHHNEVKGLFVGIAQG